MVVLCLSMLGCSESDMHQPLRIGTNVWPGYEPLYLARELGYLEAKKVQLIEYTSATQVLRAYRNNLLDGAALTLDEAINLLASGEEPRIILVTDISEGGDVLLAQPDIEDIKQLAGKRIGVEHTALGAYFISRMIEISELDRRQLHLVPLEVAEHERAFAEKKVDAVVTFEPVKSKLEANGANTLFSSQSIPGEIVDVLVVRREVQENRQAYIDHIKSAWFRALDYMDINPESSGKIIGKRMKLNAEDALKSYDGLKLPNERQNSIMLDGGTNGADLYLTSKKLSKVMHELELTKSLIDTQPLFAHEQ